MDPLTPEAYENMLAYERRRNRHLENYCGFLKGSGCLLAFLLGVELPPGSPVFFITHFFGLTHEPFFGGLGSVLLYVAAVWVSSGVYERESLH